MTLLVDIGCPDCGRTGSVRKRGLGRYYCTECDREFTQGEVTALPDPSTNVEDE
jgi:ribosomal protein L37AE/L43A